MDIYNIPLAGYSMESAVPPVKGFAWTSKGRRK
jgi:hypothetical protein